jgi:hypothetical protein
VKKALCPLCHGWAPSGVCPLCRADAWQWFDVAIAVAALIILLAMVIV